jgi:hypothetical protein
MYRAEIGLKSDKIEAFEVDHTTKEYVFYKLTKTKNRQSYTVTKREKLERKNIAWFEKFFNAEIFIVNTHMERVYLLDNEMKKLNERISKFCPF